MFPKKISISWQSFFAFAMCAMLLLHIFGLIAPLRKNDIYNTYGLVCIVACAAIYFYKKGISGPWEIKLFIAYVAWGLVTRWLNRDYYLLVDFKFVVMVLFSFLLFAVGTLLNSRQREILLDVLSIIYAGFFVLVSFAAIFVTVTNTYIHLPPENVWINIIARTSRHNSLNLLSSPTAIAAGRVFIAWSLLVYQLIKQKNLFVRVLLLISIFILHVTIPLLHCRNMQIVLSMSYGMLALIFAIRCIDAKTNVFKVVIFPIITAAAIVVCFFSFNWSNRMVTKIYDFSAPLFETFYDGLENKLNPDYFGIVLTPEELAELAEIDATYSESAFTPKPIRSFIKAESTRPSQLTNKGNMVDPRNIFDNLTLSGRTSIWQSGIIALKENPIICFCGSLTNCFMDIVNEIRQKLVNTTNNMSHMHNMFLQVLMITGIPGLLLVVFWTILMVKNMLKMYFSSSKCIRLELKALTIPVAGIFVYNLAEVIIFGKLDIIGMCFFILAGIFVGYYYDFFPLAKKTKI